MKSVSHIFATVASALLCVECISASVINAEGLLPESSASTMTTYYNSADINRNATVDIVDYTVLNNYLLGNRYVGSPKLMDADGNGVVSRADLQCIMNGVVEADDYRNYVTGSAASHKAFSTSFTYAPTGQTSRTYYRHVFKGVSSAPKHYDGTYTLYSNDGVLPTSISEPNYIIGTDNMTPETDSDLKSGIVRVSSGGTGFVVGDHVIATAAHCVYNIESNTWLDDAYVQFPQENLETNPSCIYVNPNSYHYDVVQAHIDNRYFSDTSYDVALLTVAENLSDHYHFELGVMDTDKSINLYNSYITGFPSTHSAYWMVNGHDELINASMYTSPGKFYKGSALTLQPQSVYYTSDSTGGDSGGPVYLKETVRIYKNGNEYDSYNYLTVVGIHRGGALVNTCNKGTKIDSQYLKFFLNNSEIVY